MALKNYSTLKTVTETVSDIHVILARHGAKKVMFDYDDKGEIVAIAFMIDGPNGPLAVKLPANTDRVLQVLKKQKADPKNRSNIDCSPEQAQKVAWRIVKDWLDAQMAILETEMVEMPQLFLPYFVNREGQTLYEAYRAGRLLHE